MFCYIKKSEPTGEKPYGWVAGREMREGGREFV
jgi:hypothetical protein